MRRTNGQRGLTLIEAMIAMAVMIVGVTGLVGLSRQGLRLNAEGRRLTSAVGVAQDLAQQIETWEYLDPRLGNTSTANDADYADAALEFENEAPADAPDHAEADLEKDGTKWLGIPGDTLTTLGYQRFWNVAEIDDQNANGVPDGKRIAVIVRWQPQGDTWRRVVLHVAKLNPDPAERL